MTSNSLSVKVYEDLFNENKDEDTPDLQKESANDPIN
jgi:hypothetical protein